MLKHGIRILRISDRFVNSFWNASHESTYFYLCYVGANGRSRSRGLVAGSAEPIIAFGLHWTGFVL
jgi:hypothetical protein